MQPDDVPVLAVLRQALAYHNDRQRVIAENVANANTPGFTPRDIPRTEFERALEGAQRVEPVSLTVSEPGHISGREGARREYTARRAPDTETTINGNSVVLEEQMVRANENRMRFETVLGLYQKSLALMRMASSPPGR
ncbi:flagellar basal body rod protein FlgB [Marinicauda salina]|uniref:Flagellar basal body rod protein FlgB n=1 Tax=Marinicauda salina TaxID=2135793 RepID=A0A2U2BUA9_9PROT|nr:flagellar basal body rod protein FlgB [Marinicauda salina]PWE17544.1 flagellar basal body rod protein FlgB [Marinicauda salina]